VRYSISIRFIEDEKLTRISKRLIPNG